MDNKKDIGQFFKENLNNLDKNPSELIWKSIEKDLEKKKKRSFLLYFFVGFLSLLGVSIIFYCNQNETTNFNSKMKTEETISKNEIEKSEFLIQTDTVYKNKKNKTTKSTSTKKLIATNAEYDEYEVVTRYKVYKIKTKTAKIITKKQLVSKSKRKIITKKSASVNNFKSKNNLLKNKNIKSKKQAYNKKTKRVVKKIISQKQNEVNKNTVIEDLNKPNSFSEKNQVTNTDSTIIKKDTVAKKKKLKLKKEVEKQVLKDSLKTLKLYINFYGGKNYFDDFKGKSALITGNQNIKTSGGFGYNFGVLARIMISKKIGFRTGIGYSVWNYTTIIQNENNNNWILEQTNVDVFNLTNYDDFNSKFVINNQIKLSEQLNYFEIPVEFYYIISNNKKIGIDGFVGISSHFLHKTTVFATSAEEQKTVIGKANNEIKLLETLNIGLVFNYAITKKLKFEIAPVFKNQFQIQKNNSDFKAYTFNANAGFSYKIL